MQKIDEKTWEAVRLTEIFDTISRGKRIKKSDHIPGDVPYVSSTALANGTDGSCGNEKNVRKFGDCLTLANSGSVGSCFYHPYDFVASDHVTALSREGTSEDCYLGLSTLVGRLGEKYNFNREINDARISREHIMLPLSDAGEPDYNYIEQYIRLKRSALLTKYQCWVKTRIAELGETIDIPQLNEMDWRAFVIKDIADVYSGHDIYAQERVDGRTPLVTAVGTNNGIGYFVGNENDSRAEKSISVVRNGASVGKAFYHKYSALYGNDCRRMKLKHSNSEFVNLFIAQMIGMQNKAFSYSRKLGTERLLNLRIMLPVTDDGAPDYKYMEQYVKNLMSRKYKQYLAYLDSKGKTDTIATSD